MRRGKEAAEGAAERRDGIGRQAERMKSAGLVKKQSAPRIMTQGNIVFFRHARTLPFHGMRGKYGGGCRCETKTSVSAIRAAKHQMAAHFESSTAIALVSAELSFK